MTLTPDFSRPADNVIGDDALDEDGADHAQVVELDVDVGESLLLATPPGDRVEPNVLGLVVAALGGGVDGAVRDGSGGDAKRGDDLANRIFDALYRLRVDGDIALLGALELNLGPLLVAGSDL